MQRFGGRTWWPAAAFLMATLAACGGKSGNGTTGPDGDVGQIAGDYGLAMVDAVTAPVVIDFDNCGSIQFRAGSVSLAEDGTW